MLRIDVGYTQPRVRSASSDNQIRIWNTFNGECVHAIRDLDDPILALSFNGAGRILAAGTANGRLHVYDTFVRTTYPSSIAGPTITRADDEKDVDLELRSRRARRPVRLGVPTHTRQQLHGRLHVCRPYHRHRL